VQAKDYYEKAIAALEETRKRLDYAKEQVLNGRMVSTIIDRDPDSEAGWTWKLYDLPAAPETFYLQSLIAENRYQEAIKNFRDVRLMERNLDAWLQRLDKLQAGTGSRDTGEIPASQLFARAKALAAPTTARVKPVSPPKLQLVEKMDLGEAIPEVDSTEPSSLPLKLSATPARFEGVNERIAALKGRIEADKPKLKAAELAQGKILQRIALEELAGQRKQTEKYLVEARFALARIYDRTLRPESTSP
jgi:hypothetical protein